MSHYRISKEGKELYKKRKEKVERSFADSKQNHGYRYAMYKGIRKNQHYTWLICAAQNMKNIAIKNDNVGKNPTIITGIFDIFKNFFKNLFYLLKFYQTKTTSSKKLVVCLQTEENRKLFSFFCIN